LNGLLTAESQLSCRAAQNYPAENSLLFYPVGDTPRFVQREAENPEQKHSKRRAKTR
jgi:hypothetical protein